MQKGLRNFFLALFLLGGIAFAQDALAAVLCSDSTVGWKGVDFPCDIEYTENVQGSGLSACEYLVINEGGSGAWQSAGACSGPSARLAITIFVGSGESCSLEGQDKCIVSARATDNSGNISPATELGRFDIDYSPPTAPVLSSFPPSPKNNSTETTWGWNVSTDAGSGLAAVPYAVEWSQSSIFSPPNPANSATTSFTSFPLSNLATGTWYFRVRARDQVGNNSAWSNPVGSVVIDVNGPSISSFNALPAPPAWVNSTNAIATISWTVIDNEGNLDQVEAFRANFNQNGCNDTDKSQCSWALQQTLDAPSGSGSWSSGYVNVPPGNPQATYWYGVHAVDTLENRTTETQAGLSPRKVQVDKANPTTPGAPVATTLPEDSTPTWQWGASTDTGGSGILRYHVQWSTSSSFPGNEGSPAGQATTTQTTYTHQQDLTQNTTWYFRVRAEDVAGNFSSHAQGSIVLSTNSVPVISSVFDAPNVVVKEGTQITLGANWSDADGDPAQVFFCKTNQFSSGACTVGMYCSSAANPASCDYTTVASDQPQKTYFGFICDNGGACSSSSVQDTFLVDATAPTISGFSIDPTTVTSSSPNTVVSWSVSDAGGSHLKQAEVRRKGINEPDTQWVPVFSTLAPANSDGPWTPNPIPYAPAGPDGTYLYGLRVWDNVDYMATEIPAMRVEVVVALNQPPTASVSCSPGSCTGYAGDVLTWMNNATDPDGSSDIMESRWDIVSWGSVPDATCPGLCNYTLPIQSPGTYSATLTVEDAGGLSDTSNPVQFTVLQDIFASFDCSLDGSLWQACSQVNPAKNQTVFFRDTSVASQGASITNRSWTFAGGTPASSSQQNPSSSFSTTGLHQVSLTATDSAGRQDTAQTNVNVAPQFPEYQEISPF